MNKYFKFMLIGALTLGFAACSNDDPEINPDQPSVAEGVFILNQGNYGKQIEGSISLLDYNSDNATQNLFQTANKRSLGSTPQAAVVYGSKVYIGIYGSNTIEIVDRISFKSIKQISLENEEGQSPRALIAKDGKVYISMYNGYVSRLDTVKMAIDATVKVGPNPEIMAIKGNTLYVPNSDGMNWKEGYGTTASKIDLASFNVTKTFDVGLNPCEFVSNGSDLFLLCKGNYGDVASTIYRINDNDEMEKIAEGTLVSIKDKNLYYINAPYGAPEVTYNVYDITSKTTKNMVADGGVDAPAGLGIDPVNGNIVITSYSLDNGYTSYSTNGYAKIYDAQGNMLHRYGVGVGPVGIFFNYK